MKSIKPKKSIFQAHFERVTELIGKRFIFIFKTTPLVSHVVKAKWNIASVKFMSVPCRDAWAGFKVSACQRLTHTHT